MKATIYTEDGKVCREVECDKMEPYGQALMSLKGAGIRTNHPIVVSGKCEEWDHMLRKPQELFDVTLTMGETFRKWDGARNLLVQGNSRWFAFWHKGEWHNVVGQVLIENMRNA